MKPGLFPWWFYPKSTKAGWTHGAGYAWTYEYNYVWGTRKVDHGQMKRPYVIRWTR